jgi:hypothetical protein
VSQRDSGYERKERDLYETPEWVTEALLPYLPDRIEFVWEPACGSGKMQRVLERKFKVWATDLDQEQDFLLATTPEPPKCDAIITNPPYELGQEFCSEALRIMENRGGFVAMLMRTDFDHAKSRTHLFRDCPAFAKKIVLMKRICWFVEADGKPKASPSFNHAWYIWDWKHEGPPTIAYGP